MPTDTDAIIVGAGLAGLVAACELLDAGKRVIVVDQEPEQSLGGQAFWSFGGLFLVNSPEQRRLGIRDSQTLALEDWMGTAGFDRDDDRWPRQWAEAYVDFATNEKRGWLREREVRFFPIVGWAERGGANATGRGNSVPRFHITWGTGPGLLEPFVRRTRDGERAGRLAFRFRHCVNELVRDGAAVTGVRGDRLEPSSVERGQMSSRTSIGAFELSAQAVIVTSGGIGGNHALVRMAWPSTMGRPPERMIAGVPHHVDGRMLRITEAAGGRVINGDRMWHYVEGIRNWKPIWPNHAIRILAGPSALWLDATGHRLPPPFYPGFDTLGTMRYLRSTGFDHSWLLLNRRVIAKEFVLSGSEQNPDLTGKSWWQVLSRVRGGVPRPVQAFLDHGVDFIVERNLETLVQRMNALEHAPQLELSVVEREVRARDLQVGNPYAKDAQVTALRAARAYIGDRLTRTVAPHRLLDPAAGPLIAVRLSVLTRKTLGGLETDLESRVLDACGQPIAGLFAAGEVAGFGGGGVHGYAALEGTFLGGCIFSGRSAGRAVARAIV